MKRSFRINVDGEEMTVSVERQGDELIVERDGESYRVTVLPDATQPPGEARPLRASGTDVPGSPLPVGSVPAAPQPGAPAPPESGPGVPAPPESGPGVPAPPESGPGVPAPITGTVKEVLVKAGERITAGERVMMMEAMKMDIEIVAPAAGTVVQVFVRPGDSVRENQPLFRIE